MATLNIKATIENLGSVLDFVSEQLKANDCTMKAATQIAITVEEIFVNIAHYAYTPEIGEATVVCEVVRDPFTVTITFVDSGKPYDPLAKADPNITTPAEERDIGGLGIFMVKKSMDSVEYEYKDGKNILIIKKEC